jgi:hypothetical protein
LFDGFVFEHLELIGIIRQYFFKRFDVLACLCVGLGDGVQVLYGFLPFVYKVPDLRVHEIIEALVE